LKTKKKKKFAFAVSFLLPLFGVLFLSNGMTGNVVKEGVGDSGFQTFYIFLFAFLAVLIIGAGIFFLIKFHRKKTNRKFPISYTNEIFRKWGGTHFQKTNRHRFKRKLPEKS
jgi:type II secretory pathway component PulF